MIRIISSTIAILFCISLSAQSAIGVWKTIDDEDGKVKSHVTITEVDGKLVGHVTKLIDPEFTICTKCKGDKKDQPLDGLEILWDLEDKSDSQWGGGSIMDPKNGKIYKCKMELNGADELKVRGFLGVALFGRTQTWYRVKS